MNDKDTAWKYAFSTEMERKNNLRLDYDSVEYEVIPNTSLEDLLNLSNEVIKIHIKCKFEFDLKLSSLIRRCILTLCQSGETYVWRWYNYDYKQ